LWLFPKPLFGKFSNLGEVDKEFTLNMVIRIKPLNTIDGSALISPL